MEIKEQNVSVIIESLIARIKSLEVDVWIRDEKIAMLKAELGEKVEQR